MKIIIEKGKSKEVQRCEKKGGMMKRRGDWYHSFTAAGAAPPQQTHTKEKENLWIPKKPSFFPPHFLSSQTPPYFSFSFHLSLPCHTPLQFPFFNLISLLSNPFFHKSDTSRLVAVGEQKGLIYFLSHTHFSLPWLHSLRWELVALNSLSAGGLPTSNQTSMICLIMVTFLSYFTGNTLKQKKEGIFNLNTNFISAFDFWVQMMMRRGMRRILGEGSVSTVWISWELPPQDSHQTTLSRNTVRRLQMLSTKGRLRMIGWLLWSASISLLGLILDNS